MSGSWMSDLAAAMMKGNPQAGNSINGLPANVPLSSLMGPPPPPPVAVPNGAALQAANPSVPWYAVPGMFQNGPPPGAAMPGGPQQGMQGQLGQMTLQDLFKQFAAQQAAQQPQQAQPPMSQPAENG